MSEFLSSLWNNLKVSGSLPGLLVSTLLLVLVMIVVRALAARFILRAVETPALRRKWLVQSRNAMLLLLLLGLVMIWAEELRTLALSIVAIAVAFVVATKELILCFTGSLLKSGAGSFDIGDRIQVKDFRGDVVDQSLLATTILEVGPGKSSHQRTGRRVVIPNALFVSEPVVNESYTSDYILHVFTVPFKRDSDWRGARQTLLEAARRQCAEYLEEARRHMHRLSKQRGLDMPSVEPRVSLQIPEAEEVWLVVRVPARPSERGYVEQSILDALFDSEGIEQASPPE